MKKCAAYAGFICILFCLLFIVGCKSKNNGTSDLNGVCMAAEKNSYTADTDKVNVTWENNTKFTLVFGESFKLQKLEENEWQPVEDGSDPVFTAVGIISKPHSKNRHTYNLSLYTNSLEKGTYRIQTNFSIDQESKEYTVTANFEVV